MPWPEPTILTLNYPTWYPQPRWGEEFQLTGTLLTTEGLALPFPLSRIATVYLQTLKYYHVINGSEYEGLPPSSVTGYHRKWKTVTEWDNETTPEGDAVTSEVGHYGNLNFWPKEMYPGFYQYRAHFPGEENYGKSYSEPPVSVTVRKWDTTLTWLFGGCPVIPTIAHMNYRLRGRLFFSDGMPITDDLHLKDVPIRIKKVRRVWDDVGHTYYHDVHLPDIQTTADKHGYFLIQQHDAGGRYAYRAEFDGSDYLSGSKTPSECVVDVKR